jgi:hypothetical protein
MMALLGGMTRLAGITTRCCGGLWRYLIVRAKGRTAVELERERNRATAEVIGLLAGGDEFLEYEPGGRLRVIRRCGPRTAPTVTSEQAAGPGTELDR